MNAIPDPHTFRPAPRRALVPLAALAMLALLPVTACSGAGGVEPSAVFPMAAESAGVETAAPGVPPAVASGEATQEQGGPAAQQRSFLIRDSLERARKARARKLWDEVARAAYGVLQLDSRNEEARRLLEEAQVFTGDRSASIGQEAERAAIRAELERQRDRFAAREFESRADLLRSQHEYDEADQNYERALLTLKYSPWFLPGSEAERRVNAKKKQLAAQRESAARAARETSERETARKLRESERAERSRVRRQVTQLFTRANLSFQSRQYGRTVAYLDEALAIDPLNQEAEALKELAMRARHDNKMDTYGDRWRREWTKTFQDLQTSDVAQTDSIKHDVRYWNEIALERGPIEFSEVTLAGDPESAVIAQTLSDTRVEHNFAETSLDDWIDFYKRATGLNFFASAKVRELDEEDTTLTDFRYGKRSVRQALDMIARIKPMRWQIRDGAVQILTAEESRGKTLPRMYDVGEIISPIAQHPGRDLQQRVGEGDEEEIEEPEPVAVVVDIDKLQEIIRSTIAPESWEGEGVGITAQGSALIINQTPEVHAQVDKLLADLRGNSGIQVDIESRFLRVEDNFLEEHGIDFRGLGNQASTGKPGLGLQKKGDRTGFGFDDQGRDTSTTAPTAIGTGFEPGIFFDDGNDGDLFGRTENLFARTLGGGVDGLAPSGGFSFQYTYLDDTELEIVLRAVSKKERVEQISAPRILVHNTARANMSVNRQFTYVRDFNVEIAQSAAVADPVVDVVRDGVVLDVRPVVSADRRYILMELRPTLAQLQLPIPTFTTTLGVGQPISIQVPVLTLQKVRTTVIMPDGGTLLLGGMTQVQKQEFDAGIPILKDIPILGYLFSRKGVSNSNRKILILLRAKVIVPSEWEPAQRFSTLGSGTGTSSGYSGR